ncbi:methylmalonyl-CoA epimerase [Microbacterium sp. APC 3898]|uniref:Methylmalonyl-CoA epimerase n=1 Tax=Planococcus notacanthi TaxID=3035188 RepID=A0ABT7ZHY0_9BACL|nr:MULTISPECIES: methylmalonyl-CoA epimerase [Terrabacteria group]MDN3426765.1 methylmalonyl-CoA epimerase [Planococcus sp. APC 4016]MDN3438020.1 methylmalonyl-CoA epimerase [Planococcus sp. APC 3900]MDN3500275.1 methylmalonyl-CoA epimerase [Microbacterium sp. APC 3898]
MKKVDHIGIAVRDLNAVLPYYTDTLGLPLMKIEEVESQKVRVAFIDAGNVKLELLEAMDDQSAIYKFLEKKGEGIHHIAFGVENIEQRMEELRDKGIRLLSDKPNPGAGGAMVAFLHPKSSNGVLYELCEKE